MDGRTDSLFWKNVLPCLVARGRGDPACVPAACVSTRVSFGLGPVDSLLCCQPEQAPELCVDANLGQHTNALDRAARERARCSSPCVERSDRSNRSDRSPVRIGDGRRTRTREGPVRVGARRVVLGSAGHLEHLQTSRRRRKNSRGGWKN